MKTCVSCPWRYGDPMPIGTIFLWSSQPDNVWRVIGFRIPTTARGLTRRG